MSSRTEPAPAGHWVPGPPSLAAALREGGIALLAIVAVAVVVRAYHLGSGYWIDEIYAVQNSFRLSFADIVSTYRGDYHHPLYALAARSALVVFGESPWALRLPALIFGVVAIPATYLVARLALSRRESLLASLVLAVSYHHVWFSQNARGYTLVALLALLGTWTLVRLLETGSWRLAFAYALIAALGAYTHITMVFVAVGHALVAGLLLVFPEGDRPRIRWTVAAAAFVLAAVMTILLYAPMLGEVTDFFLNKPSALRGTSTPAWALREAIRVLLVGIGAPAAIAGAIVLAAGAAVGIAGFVSILRRRRALGLAMVIAPLVMLGGALAGRGTMYPRFFFFMAGLAVIVVVRGFFVASEALARLQPAMSASVAGTLLVSLLAGANAASLSYNYRYPKQDFTGAMDFVLRSRAAGDAVAFAGVPGDPYRTLYGQPWPTVQSVADLEAVRGAGRTWLIYTFPRYLEAGSPDLAGIVRRECHERAVFRGTVGGGDMIICTLEPSE